MPEYADIYALGRERTEQAITRFLDQFLPSRVESADEYEIPQYSQSPEKIYATSSELIRHCCRNSNEVHTVYWRSDVRHEHAMVFFLRDGGLIFGISTPADDQQGIDRIAYDLEHFLETEEVIVTYEDLPPESTEAFQSLFQSLPPRSDETARRSRAYRPIRGEPPCHTSDDRRHKSDCEEILKRWGFPHRQLQSVTLVTRDNAPACVERILKARCRFYGYDSFIVSGDSIQPVLEFSPDWSHGPLPSLSELVSQFASHPEAITHYEFVIEDSE